ncbi:MAG: hypothetical protein LBT01_07230 [Spirochaetaceae bacterium]|jgi:hypothetical protein|nr:hypothetical protein [Spirochaetaceae bacterium]
MEATLRQDSKPFIEMSPPRKIRAPMTLGPCKIEEALVYETDLTNDEHWVCEESWNSYNEHPEEFVLWSDYKKDRGL